MRDQNTQRHTRRTTPGAQVLRADDVELNIEVVAADTGDVELNIEVVAADTDDVELSIEVVAADQSENLPTLHVELKRSRQRKPRPDLLFWRAWLSAIQHAKSECQVFGQLGHFEFSSKDKLVYEGRPRRGGMLKLQV